MFKKSREVVCISNSFELQNKANFDWLDKPERAAPPVSSEIVTFARGINPLSL